MRLRRQHPEDRYYRTHDGTRLRVVLSVRPENIPKIGKAATVLLAGALGLLARYCGMELLVEHDRNPPPSVEQTSD